MEMLLQVPQVPLVEACTARPWQGSATRHWVTLAAGLTAALWSPVLFLKEAARVIFQKQELWHDVNNAAAFSLSLSLFFPGYT